MEYCLTASAALTSAFVYSDGLHVCVLLAFPLCGECVTVFGAVVRKKIVSAMIFIRKSVLSVPLPLPPALWRPHLLMPGTLNQP